MKVDELTIFEVIYFIGLIISLVILSSKKDFFRRSPALSIIGFFSLRERPVLGILYSFGWPIAHSLASCITMFKLFFLNLEKG